MFLQTSGHFFLLNSLPVSLLLIQSPLLEWKLGAILLNFSEKIYFIGQVRYTSSAK